MSYYSLTSLHRGSLTVKILKGFGAAAFWILLWQVLSLAVDQELLVPAPLAVILRLAQMIVTTGFWEIVLLSLSRIVIGFLGGTLSGTLLAVLTARSRLAALLLKPAQNVIKATPIASFIILALVWIKGSHIPAFITFLMVMPIIWANVSKGIAETDPALLEMADVYRYTSWQKVRRIYVHSVMPYFAAAATTSMGLAWKAGIAAEVLALPKISIGTAIYDSKIYLETTDLFAWSLVVILISMILEKIITMLLRKVGSAPPAREKAEES